jgi:hypothetical protein
MRRTVEIGSPPGQELRELVSLETRALPDREVGVLNGELRQDGVARRRPGVIQLLDLSMEHPKRPAIRDDVVHGHHQPMIFGAGGHDVRTKQRTACEIERRLCVRLDPARVRLFGGTGWQMRQVDDWQRDWADRIDDLHGNPVRYQESRAQCFVAAQHLGHCPVERRLIQLPFEPGDRLNVVEDGARVELIEKPQTLLGKRQRCWTNRVAARNHAKRGRRWVRAALVRPFGKRRDRGPLEHHPNGHVDAQAVSYAGDGLCRQERMPS